MATPRHPHRPPYYTNRRKRSTNPMVTVFNSNRLRKITRLISAINHQASVYGMAGGQHALRKPYLRQPSSIVDLHSFRFCLCAPLQFKGPLIFRFQSLARVDSEVQQALFQSNRNNRWFFKQVYYFCTYKSSDKKVRT